MKIFALAELNDKLVDLRAALEPVPGGVVTVVERGPALYFRDPALGLRLCCTHSELQASKTYWASHAFVDLLRTRLRIFMGLGEEAFDGA